MTPAALLEKLPIKFTLPAWLFKPKTVHQLYAVALKHYQKRQYAKALQKLTEAEAVDSSQAQVFYMRGLCYQKIGNDTDAKAAFQQALILQPEDTDCLYSLARLFYREGDEDTALAYAEMAESLLGDDVWDTDVYHLMGIIYEKQGQVPEAIRSFERSLAVFPEQPLIAVSLAKLYMKSREFAKAVDIFREEAEKDPYRLELNHYLALCLAQLGSWEESVKYSKRLVALQPEYAQGYNQLGLALYSTARYAEAKESYQKCLEVDPSFVTALNNLAYTCQKLGELDMAMSYFQEYASHVANDPAELAEVQAHITKLEDKIDQARQEAEKAKGPTLYDDNTDVAT